MGGRFRAAFLRFLLTDTQKMMTLPEEVKLVEAFPPTADAAGRNGDWVSLKQYGRCFVVVHITQGNAATIALTIQQAQDVSGTGAKVITEAVPIWVNADTSSTDTLVRQTDAVSYTTSAALANKMVVFQLDPRYFDVNNGFDCVRVNTGASNAANITQGVYVMTGTRFGGRTPRSAIID